jgi:hypothetical protein
MLVPNPKKAFQSPGVQMAGFFSTISYFSRPSAG